MKKFIFLALLAAGCSTAEQHQIDTNTTKTINTSEIEVATVSASPTDAEIADVLATSSRREIQLAQEAQKKAQSNVVKRMARDILHDSQIIQNQTQRVAKSKNWTPDDNQTSSAYDHAADRAVLDMQDLKGADYDHAFIEHQVAHYQNMMTTIDRKLLPKVQDEKLKALLIKTRPRIEARHDRLAKLQEKMRETQKE